MPYFAWFVGDVWVQKAKTLLRTFMLLTDSFDRIPNKQLLWGFDKHLYVLPTPEPIENQSSEGFRRGMSSLADRSTLAWLRLFPRVGRPATPVQTQFLQVVIALVSTLMGSERLVVLLKRRFACERGRSTALGLCVSFSGLASSATAYSGVSSLGDPALVTHAVGLCGRVSPSMHQR